MKKALYSAILAATIAAAAITAPAVAGDTKSYRVIRSSHLTKSKQDRSSVKDTTSQTDYYIRARETQMKISM